MSNHSEYSYTKGFLLGALVGGAVGAVTALLLAPKSGEELREDIARRSGEIYGKASDYLSTARDEAENMVNQGRKQADKIVNSARNQAENLMHDAEQMIQEAKYRAANAKEQVTESVSRVRDAAKAGVDAFRSEISHNSDVDTELG
jgi:gas vesicle protein